MERDGDWVYVEKPWYMWLLSSFAGFAVKVLLCLVLIGVFSLAHAQETIAPPGPACEPSTKAHAMLQQQFGERVVWTGLGNRGGLFELLQSEDGSTWSLLITDFTADGQRFSCLVASGSGGQAVLSEPDLPGDPL